MTKLFAALRKLIRVVMLLVLLPLAVGFVFLCIGYVNAAKSLPPLNSEYDLETGLRVKIEGERRSLRGEAGRVNEDVHWPRPSLADYPHDFVAIYLAMWGCPHFFQTPRDTPLTWAWRVLKWQVLRAEAANPDGRCELYFSRDLASHLGVEQEGSLNVAAYRLRQVMQKDQLVAYDLAALRLMSRKLSQLSLAELAELSLALPPNNFYDSVRECSSPLVLKKARDRLLELLGTNGILPLERAKAAEGEPLGCLR